MRLPLERVGQFPLVTQHPRLSECSGNIAEPCGGGLRGLGGIAGLLHGRLLGPSGLTGYHSVRMLPAGADGDPVGDGYPRGDFDPMAVVPFQ